MDQEIFKRQIEFFGLPGQQILNDMSVAVVGVGGIGSHVVQQLAFLGVGTIALIDADKLEKLNKNRLIGVRFDDPIGTLKVDIAERNIKTINPNINVVKIDQSLISPKAFDAVLKADFSFSSVDNDGARLVLNELCLAYTKPFIDVASDIIVEESEYGGHIISVVDDRFCLFCLDQIDPEEARRHLLNPAARKDWEAIYGVDKKLLGNSGPSVVTINGIVSSVATTEYMLHVTGIRGIKRFLKYRGSRGLVIENTDTPRPNCYYCNCVRGMKERANVERYLNNIF